jgi:oligosaccharyltransferase complex subunit alpha (ribophorin I)
MKGMVRLTVLLGFLAIVQISSVLGAVDRAFVIENVKRVIRLGNLQGTETTLSYKVTRKDASASAYMVTLLSEEQGGRISKFACQVEKDVILDLSVEKTDKGVSLKVPLPASFSSGTIFCQLFRVGKGARRPYPAEIAQLEKQRFLFEGDTIRMHSPYELNGEEVTELTLPRGKIDLLEEAPGIVLSGNKVTCGPYKTAAASAEESSARFRIQYDANSAVPVASYVEREIEISHWGNVAVEEYFDVKNDGAKLKGEFSRLDHQTHQITHAFQSLQAILPYEAYGVYYRDELGNVTTSHLWKPKNKEATELLLKLRFPLYGGWHIEWYHGYNVPLTTFVSKVQGTADRYLLDCELAHPMNILAEKLVLHIVLPPGATNVRVESPVKHRIIQESTFRRYTYLDVPWTARNVLSLELHDVFSEVGAKSIENRLRVYYSYSDVHVAEKPLTVSATIFSVLFGWMVWGRLSSSSK